MSFVDEKIHADTDQSALRRAAIEARRQLYAAIRELDEGLSGTPVTLRINAPPIIAAVRHLPIMPEQPPRVRRYRPGVSGK